MNIQQLQFNRQQVAALLLAGLILAATIGLTWANGSISQETGSVKAATAGYDGRVWPWSQGNSVKGGARGGIIE